MGLERPIGPRFFLAEVKVRQSEMFFPRENPITSARGRRPTGAPTDVQGSDCVGVAADPLER
jgi:hypothetical protein